MEKIIIKFDCFQRQYHQFYIQMFVKDLQNEYTYETITRCQWNCWLRLSGWLALQSLDRILQVFSHTTIEAKNWITSPQIQRTTQSGQKSQCKLWCMARERTRHAGRDVVGDIWERGRSSLGCKNIPCVRNKQSLVQYFVAEHKC